MEKSDLLERIREEFSSYSKGQKAIATYILEKYDMEQVNMERHAHEE